MKLHDNTCFGGRGVVLRPYEQLVKAQGLVELLGAQIGSPNLEENVPVKFAQPRLQKGPRNTLAATVGGHRQIENFRFTRRKCTQCHEAGDSAAENGDVEIIVQIIRGGPLGSFGAGCLNSTDCVQIVRLPGTDDQLRITFWERSSLCGRARSVLCGPSPADRPCGTNHPSSRVPAGRRCCTGGGVRWRYSRTIAPNLLP